VEDWAKALLNIVAFATHFKAWQLGFTTVTGL
jgi:hypothetical protein